MTKNLSPLDLNNNPSFGDWLNLTNEMATIFANDVPTANSDAPVEGFIEINGELRANTGYFDELRGGTFNNEQILTFKTETNFEKKITANYIETETIKVGSGVATLNDVLIYPKNNTTLVFEYIGTDGISRSAELTLD